MKNLIYSIIPKLRNNLNLIKKKISGIYLVSKPVASKEEYLQIHNKAKKNINIEVTKLVKEFGFPINKNWLDKLALKTQIVKKKNQIDYQHGRLIYSLIRNQLKTFTNQNYFKILEVGTARGFSSIIMSKAILDSKKKGKIATIDIIPHNKKIYWNTIDDLEGPQTRKHLLRSYKKYLKSINFLTGESVNIIKNIKTKQFNFIFLDGNHDFYYVMKEYDLVKNLQKKNDLLLLDDVTPKKFDGIIKLLNIIKKENKYTIRKITSNPKRGYAILEKK